MKQPLAYGAALLLLASANPASGTYSIVASDVATQQVGGSGTSCLMGGDVYVIYGSAPARGVVHAQALANQAGRNRAVQLLEQGIAPAEVLAAITSASFDPNAASRQYGVVDVMGRSAGFTGSSARAFADDQQGRAGTFSYSVQGNILTGASVLTRAAAAFESNAGCDLAERLLLALEAGAENMQGDSRCTTSLRIPADSAFLQVEAPNTPRGSFLALRVRASGRDNPLVALRAQYTSWRAANPCPATGGSGSGGGPMGGTGGAVSGAGGVAGTGASTGGVPGAGASTGGVPTAGASTGGVPGAGASTGGVPTAGASTGGVPGAGASGGSTSLGAGGSSAAGARPSDPDGDSSSCACRSGRPSTPVDGLTGAALALLCSLRVRQRRSHRRSRAPRSI